MSAPAGLYIHIPFCKEKCEYCDFYSITQLEQIQQFTEALLIEIRLRAPQFQETVFDTVFFGGGTPSLLSAKQITQIWDELNRAFNISSNAEISIESNPGTLDFDKLALYKSLGFNRLSMGVQSFNPDELKFLGRIHSTDDVFENFANARKAGFTNINIDLMTAFPGITHDRFMHSLSEAFSLKTEHISCYTLIFEPGTVFYKRMKKGDLKPIPEDQEATFYEIAAEKLGAQNYQQYEISNFAKTGKICQHNLIYWQHQPYLGLGPSAHSFVDNTRFGNKRSLQVYLKTLRKDELPIDFTENLPLEKLMFEYIFLGLRLKSGINLNTFESRFGESLLVKYRQQIDQLMNDGLVNISKSHLQLSEKGWMIADEVATYF